MPNDFTGSSRLHVLAEGSVTYPFLLQAYYDELLQGKTGRHDMKIKELKEKLV